MNSIGRYIPLAACLAVLCGLVLHFFSRYLPYALGVLRYPYSIDYGEGIVWQQALLIPGDRMYASIDAYPFIVFHYTPVYHLFARLIAHLGLDYLTSGRLLSLASTLSIAIVIGLLTFRSTRMIAGRRGYVAAAIGALAIFTAVPVFTWSPLMRVDMLAVALSLAGVYLAALSINRPALLYWASVVFVLALYTKQSSIAAPLVSLSVMLAVRPRQALFAAGLGLVVGSVIFLLLDWKTHGGFPRHILLYNINRLDLRHGMELTQIVFRRHAFYIAAVAFYLLGTWWSVTASRPSSDALACFRARLGRDRWFFGLTLLSVYLIVSTALLAAVAKTGSWHNYFIEWICVWCALLGMASASVLGSVSPSSASSPRWSRPSLVAVVFFAFAIQVTLPRTWAWDGLPGPEEARNAQIVLEKIQAARGPVLSDEMVLLMKAGKEVPIEPVIFRELTYKGLWNEQLVIDLIKSHYFEFVVTAYPRWVGLWSPGVQRAIDEAYPQTVEYSRYSIHRASDSKNQ